MTTRERVLQVLDELPQNAGIGDVIECLSFVQKLEHRLQQASTVDKYYLAEARRRMVRWLE